MKTKRVSPAFRPLPVLTRFGTPARPCGGCTACCTIYEIEETGKPQGETCAHCTGGGCGIYRDRPRICRDYSCAWRDGVAAEDARPDRCGVVFDYAQTPRAPLLIAYEVVPGALEGPRARAAIEHLLRKGAGVFLVHAGGTVRPNDPMLLLPEPTGDGDAATDLAEFWAALTDQFPELAERLGLGGGA